MTYHIRYYINSKRHGYCCPMQRYLHRLSFLWSLSEWVHPSQSWTTFTTTMGQYLMEGLLYFGPLSPSFGGCMALNRFFWQYLQGNLAPFDAYPYTPELVCPSIFFHLMHLDLPFLKGPHKMRSCPGRLRIKPFPVPCLIYVYPKTLAKCQTFWQYVRCGRMADLNRVSFAGTGKKK